MLKKCSSSSLQSKAIESTAHKRADSHNHLVGRNEDESMIYDCNNLMTWWAEEEYEENP